MLGYAFIMYVQICNLIWRNVIVYLDLITTSPYLLGIHLNYQHTEVSFNWILLSNHFKMRHMYSITRNEAMWKKTLLSCSLLSPSCRARPSCYSNKEPRDRARVLPSVNPAKHLGKKDPFSPLGIQWRTRSCSLTADFSQYAYTNILLHTRNVLLMHISQFSPFAILWYFTDLSWRTLNSACMKLTQKVHYNYRWIIRPKNQTRSRPKQNPLY